MSSVPDDEEPEFLGAAYGLSSMPGMFGIAGTALNASLYLSDTETEDDSEEETELGPDELDVHFVGTALNILLADYVAMVHEPERELSRRRAILNLKDRSHIPEMPELWNPINIGAVRQDFAEKWLNDKNIDAIKRLFENGGLIWDTGLEVRRRKQVKKICSIADDGVYDDLEPRLLAFETGIRQWAIKTQDIDISDPSTIYWNLDPVVADVLADGRTAIARESEFNAINRAAHYSETILLLEQIANGEGTQPPFSGEELREVGRSIRGIRRMVGRRTR